MPLEPELREMLTDTILHATYQGQDAYGKPSYGSAIERPARVEFRVVTVTNQQGQERTSNTTVITDSDFEIDVRDRITLPDDTAPAIQQIYSPTDPTQPGVIHHREIRL